MRVFIVCAVVAAGFLYYMLNQEGTGPVYRGSNVKAGDVMSECLKRKAKEYEGVDQPGASLERMCASENDIRFKDGEWK